MTFAPRLPLKLPKAVLFDWDNTLVDTLPLILEATNLTFTAMGRPPCTIEDLKTHGHKSLRETFPNFFGAQWQIAEKMFYEHIHQNHLKTLQIMEGAHELVKTLYEQDIYLAVISNKRGPVLRKEISHLGWDSYFKAIIGSGDCLKDKPAPDPVFTALPPHLLPPTPEHVWFVGDTASDYECAHATNCLSILIESHKSSFPTISTHNCYEILALIKALS